MRNIPEIYVDLDAPATERWQEAASDVEAEIHGLTESVLELCRHPHVPFLASLVHSRSRLLGFLGEIPSQALIRPLLQECRGIEKVTGIPASMLALANCAYDYTQWNPMGIIGCSAAVVSDGAKCPVMLRYMDWSLPENIADYSVITHFHTDGVIAYSSLGFAGFLGVVTAVGSAWAVALNQAPSPKVKKSIFGSPACYAMRVACDESGTYSELLANIRATTPMTPFLSLVCGTEESESARIEKPYQGKTTITKGKKDEVLALTNHYLHRDHRKYNVETEWEDEDGQKWVIDTKERFCEVHRIAQEVEGFTRWPTMKSLDQDPVRNESTVHLAIMRPATQTLRCKKF